jgi:hypothetical protein
MLDEDYVSYMDTMFPPTEVSNFSVRSELKGRTLNFLS